MVSVSLITCWFWIVLDCEAGYTLSGMCDTYSLLIMKTSRRHSTSAVFPGNKKKTFFTSTILISLLTPGQPGRQGSVGRAAAPPKPGKLRVPDGDGQLLQGGALHPGRGAWGAAPPAPPRGHLAASQGPAAPAAPALRLPAGRTAGEELNRRTKLRMQTLEFDTSADWPVMKHYTTREALVVMP